MKKKLWPKIVLAVFAVIVLFLGYQIYMIQHTYAALDDVPADYTYGPADADLTVVEFVKYTCPHCRDIHPVIMDAVTRDGKVRYIPRPLPSDKVGDAQFVYAAGKQGLFKLAHPLLLQDPRILDEGGLMAIAETMGADKAKLQEDMQSPDVEKLINDNIDVFLNIGGNRTPTFMIGTDIMYVPQDKMPTAEDFLTMFKEARAQ